MMKTAFVVLVVLAGAGGLTVGGEQPEKFRVRTKRADDAVGVSVEKDRTIFTVKTPFGISRAVVESADDNWPESFVLRLRLKGLESFRSSNGKDTLDAAVSVQDGEPKVRLWKDGKEDAPPDEKSKFWTEFRVVVGDGKPAKELPLKNGYFEMSLPKAFFEGNPKSITLNWIDFYRN
jgi:hypothetical protein